MVDYLINNQTVDTFTVKSNSGDGVLTVAANAVNKDAIIYLGTHYEGNMSNGMKAAIIAEGLQNYSRSKLHFCLNNQGMNGVNASLTDSRMVIEPDGDVGIQGSVSASSFQSLSDTRIKANQKQVPYDDCKQIFINVAVKSIPEQILNRRGLVSLRRTWMLYARKSLPVLWAGS